MTLDEMRARRKELIDKTRNLRNIANEQSRQLTEEETRVVNESLERSEHLSQEIHTEERLGAQEDLARESHREAVRPDVGGGASPPGEPKFFRSLGEQMRAVHDAAVDPRRLDPRLSTRAATGLSEGLPSDGGFLVQQDFATELYQLVHDTGQVASRVQEIPISGNANSTKIPGIDEVSRADGSRWGGIRAYWAAEGGTLTSLASRPKFRSINLELEKLIGLCYATDEVLADSAQLETVIRTAFVEEFAFKLDDALINGDGSGKPLGILASPALVSVNKETGQPADTIQPENIIKMWSRCWARSRMNAVWYINQDIEPQLFTLGIQVGVGGSTVYMPPGGLSAQPYGTLFGRPVIPIEQCATLGDKGDIILADMKQYALARKGGMQSAVSIHVQFVTDESVFRFILRVDGEPFWHSALTPYKGTSNTLSPFVTLDARA